LPLTAARAELIIKKLLQTGQIQSLSKRNLMIAREQAWNVRM